MFGAASFVVTFSILAAIVATNPPASDTVAVESVNATAQRYFFGLTTWSIILYTRPAPESR